MTDPRWAPTAGGVRTSVRVAAASDEKAGPVAQAPPSGLRVGLLTALALAVALLWRNRDLFRIPLYEVGDAAANSLLVNDAKALELLVGHYSRVGFNHPGPAVLYLQAAGEALFTDLLAVTPAPLNGQLVAVTLLHAAVLGAVAGVVQRWSGRWPVAVAAVAAALLWYGAHEFSLAGAWIPVLVIAPFLLLLVSAASVAAGQARHLPLLAATGGLLVHAHVAFVLFVTVLALAAVAAWALRERLSPRALLRSAPAAWAAGVAVVAAFLAPIALNTLLNWPGEIPKYLGYSGGQVEAGTERTLGAALLFSRQAWTATESDPAGGLPLAVAAAGVVLALAASVLAPRPLRLPLLLLTGVTLLAEALLVLYAFVGVDDLGQIYVGYFGRSLPAALLLVVGVAVAARVDALPRPRGLGPTLGAAAAALGLGAAVGDASQIRPEFTTTVPQVVAPVLAEADDQPLLLEVGQGPGPFLDATALLLQAERAGVPACVVDADLRVQVTAQRICDPAELESGLVVSLEPQGSQTEPTTRAGFSDITVAP